MIKKTIPYGNNSACLIHLPKRYIGKMVKVSLLLEKEQYEIEYRELKYKEDKLKEEKRRNDLHEELLKIRKEKNVHTRKER